MLTISSRNPFIQLPNDVMNKIIQEHLSVVNDHVSLKRVSKYFNSPDINPDISGTLEIKKPMSEDKFSKLLVFLGSEHCKITEIDVTEFDSLIIDPEQTKSRLERLLETVPNKNISIKGDFEFKINLDDMPMDSDKEFKKIFNIIQLPNFKPQKLSFVIEQLKAERTSLEFFVLYDFFTKDSTKAFLKKLDTNIKIKFKVIAPKSIGVDEFIKTIKTISSDFIIERLFPKRI